MQGIECPAIENSRFDASGRLSHHALAKAQCSGIESSPYPTFAVNIVRWVVGDGNSLTN